MNQLAEGGGLRLSPQADGTYKWRSMTVNGIVEHKDKHKGKSAVIWGSGPSFRNYDDSLVPEDWVRFSINETIALNFPGFKKNPDYWVLSDIPIVGKYAKYCPEDVNIITTHRAGETIGAACPKHKINRILAQPEPVKDYSDGYQVFSRRTVIIAAVEIARYMGIENVYIFGLDHFRLRSSYYYDRTDANSLNERKCAMDFVVPGTKRYEGERLFQTPALRGGAQMIAVVVSSGLWDGINVYNVNSPQSLVNSIKKISLPEFIEKATEDNEPEPAIEKPKKKRGRPKGSKNKKEPSPASEESPQSEAEEDVEPDRTGVPGEPGGDPEATTPADGTIGAGYLGED